MNLFRDQLDRAGEIDHVQDVIAEALAASPQTMLLVNGDDPLSVAIARRAERDSKTKVLSFGVEEALDAPAGRVPEARFCPECGAEFSYDYRSYAQLGAFHCSSCDFARPPLDFAAREVEVGLEGVSFCLRVAPPHADGSVPGASTCRLQASFGGTYMVYNLLAACAASLLAGATMDDFQGALDDYHPQNGRLQHFVVSGREVVLNLAKNPTGLNQNLSLLAKDARRKVVYVLVNDNANLYERYAHAGCKRHTEIQIPCNEDEVPGLYDTDIRGVFETGDSYMSDDHRDDHIYSDKTLPGSVLDPDPLLHVLHGRVLDSMGAVRFDAQFHEQ